MIVVDSALSVPTSGPTDALTLWLKLIDAVVKLQNHPLTNGLLSRVPGDTIITTFRDGSNIGGDLLSSGALSSWNSGGGTYRAKLQLHMSGAQSVVNALRANVIIMEPREAELILTGTRKVIGADGKDYLWPAERFIFHESVHLATLSDPALSRAFTNSNPSDRVRYDVSEGDTIAIAAENVIFRQAFGGKESGPHGGPRNTVSATGVKAFDLVSGVPALSLENLGGSRAWTLQESDEKGTLRFIVFERGSTPRTTRAQPYNHYVVNEVVETSGSFAISKEGILSQLVTIVAQDDAAAPEVAEKALEAADFMKRLGKFVSDNLLPDAMTPSDLRTFILKGPDLNQATTRSLSIVKSSFQQINSPALTVAVGPQDPVPNAADTAAPYLALAAETNTPSVLVGASGFTSSKYGVDFAGRLDDLKGSRKNDLLLGGDGSGAAAPGARTILDGGEGDDIILSGSSESDLNGGAGNDTLLLGEGKPGFRSRVDGGTGADLLSFREDPNSLEKVSVEFDLTKRSGEYYLASRGSVTVEFKRVEIFVGGPGQATFRGVSGEASTFIAGEGGGIFHLAPGNSAYGNDGKKDVFYISAKVPDGIVEDALRKEYLKTNRVFIANLGSEDEIIVNGKKFDGARVTSQLAPVLPYDSNADFAPVTSVWLTGESSYGFNVPKATYQQGDLYSSYVYQETESYRTVSLAKDDSSGVSVISFRAGTATGDGGLGSEFRDKLKPDAVEGSFEWLDIVIDGFEDGDAGVTFRSDMLSAGGAFSVAVMPTDAEPSPFGQFVAGNVHGGVDGDGRSFIYALGALDALDGVADGRAYGGGGTLSSDDPRYDLGENPYGGAISDYASYVSGALDRTSGDPAGGSLSGGTTDDRLTGGIGADTLLGGAGDDELRGGDGNDILRGEDGDDRLFGEEGDDLLEGGDGDDLLDGGAGADTLRGGADEDVLEGGAGDDLLVGGAGGDSYVYRLGDGHDVIDDGGLDGVDTLQFGAGVTLGDIVVSRVADSSTDLRISFTNNAGSILIKHQLDGQAGVEELEFEDGSYLSASNLAALAPGANGENDVPTQATDLTVSTIVERSGSNVSSTPQVLTGEVVFDDADLLDIHVGSVTGVSASGSISGLPSEQALLALFSLRSVSEPALGRVGSIGWRFTASDRIFDYLSTGETVILDYEVEIEDGAGGSLSHSVQFAVSGTNDAPVVAQGSVLARSALLPSDGGTPVTNLTGTVRFTDAELGDVHSASVVAVETSGLTAGLPAVETLMGWFDAGPVVQPTGVDAGSVAWQFSAPAGALDTLRNGGEATLTYVLRLADGHGGTVDQRLRIALYGSEASWVRGGSGDDYLDGGDAARTFVGGGGNDRLIGHEHEDSYLYTSTDGDLMLEDYSNSHSSVDTLRLTDLSPGDVTFYTDRSQGEDTYIRVNATGRTVRLYRQWQHGSATPGWGIERVVFVDGTTWNRSQIQAASWFRARPQDVRLEGYGDFDNTFEAGAGNAQLVGFEGRDTFIYDSSDGDVTVEDYSNSGTSIDVLKLVDLDPADVTFYTDRSQGQDAYIRVNATGKVIRLQRQWQHDTSAPGWGIEGVVFADGTIWNQQQIQSASWFRAGPDNVRMDGYSEFDNTFEAGSGNAYLVGYDGRDTFIYDRTDGNVTLEEYSNSNTSIDTLKFTDLNPTDVTFYTDRSQGQDGYIRINSTGKVIRLQRQWQHDTSAPGWGIERVVFADGTVWNQQQIQHASWFRDQNGNDILEGYYEFENTFKGGGGNDYLHGSERSDTYIYLSGDGNDNIYDESNSPASIDVLKLPDLNPADVQFFIDRSQGDDVFFRVLADGATIKLSRQLGNQAVDGLSWGIDRVEFADGTVWNRAMIHAASWFRGGAGNDGFDGYGNLNNTFSGGKGDDYLHGHDGRDTYIYAKGDGSDNIYDESNSETSIDTLKLTDLNPGDLTFYTDFAQGADAFIRVDVTGEIVKLSRQTDGNHVNRLGWGIDRVEFGDGGVWDRPQIMQEVQASRGTSGADLLAVQDGALVFGGGGNDELVGGGSGMAGYRGTSSDYTVIRGRDGAVLVHDSQTGRDGSDRLVGVDQIRFTDRVVRLADRLEGWIGSSPTINDLSVAGTVVGTVAAYGATTQASVTYRLEGEGSARFAIDQLTGVVTVRAGATFNALQQDIANLQVTADFGTRLRILPLTVDLTNLGNGPVGLSLLLPTFDPIRSQAGVARDRGNGSYLLTPAQGYAFGAIWGRVDLLKDATWTAQLNFGTDDGGGDGIGFSLTEAVDLRTRSARSYGVNIPRSFGVRFATWSNTGAGNPASDFAQFVLNGNTDASATAFSPYASVQNLEDGAWHSVKLNWKASTRTLSYQIDGGSTASKTYDVSANILAGSSQGAFGFGASTGGVVNEQRIRSVAQFQAGDSPNVRSGAVGGTLVAVLQGIDGDPTDVLTYALVDASRNVVSHPTFEIVGNELRVREGAMVNEQGGTATDLFVRVSNQSGIEIVSPVRVAIEDAIAGISLLKPHSAEMGGFNGSTVDLGSGTYRLTPDEDYRAGNVWGAVDLAHDVVWTTRMFFGDDEAGADGIAFALSAQPYAPSDNGGRSLGVLNAGTFGFKFDTYRNTAQGDPNGDFSQFVVNGDVTESSSDVDGYRLVSNLEDNQWHDVAIIWNAADRRLSYVLDGEIVASKAYDVVENLFGGVTLGYFAFGAATGEHANEQKVQITSVATGSAEYSVNVGTPGGALVGILHGVDVVGANVASFAIVGGNGATTEDPFFVIVNGNELRVRSGVTIDASQQFHEINVRAVSGSGGSTVQRLAVGFRAPGQAFTVHDGDSPTAIAGADVFDVQAGFGSAEILGFSTAGYSHDLSRVSRTQFSDWEHLLGATRQVGADLQIALGEQETLTLGSVSLASFHPSAAAFV